MFKTLTSLTAGAIVVVAIALGMTAQSAGASALPPECGVGQLSAHITAGSPGAGNRYATLTLTNRSHITCRTGGYVGMGLLNSDGDKLTTHVTRDAGRVRTITLKPGARASTRLHWGAVEGTGDTRGGTCFHAPASVLVTPPNSYHSFVLPWSGGVVCETGTIDTTPLVAS